MADNFVSYDRDTLYLMPPSVQDWVGQNHLARFVVDIVAQLDLRAICESYEGRGSAAYHPRMLVALLFYGYATGIRASRKIEAATYESIPFRYIAANTHPDHDTIAAFRLRFMPQLRALFDQILVLAKEMHCLEVGKVSLDGTKIKANASKHSALSLKGAERERARLRRLVDRMLELAEEADREDSGENGFDLPAELQTQEGRLKAIAAAKERIRAREAEQQTQDQRDWEEIMADRERIAQINGRDLESRPPKRPKKGDRPNPQLNFTDDESRIMPSGDGFVQAYNAQVAVDPAMFILATDVSQRPTDRRLLKPMLQQLAALAVDRPTELLADAGYYSELNVELCVQAGLTPYIPPKRDRHHWGLRHWKAPQDPGPGASAVKHMWYRLRTAAGRETYALRKQTVEPVIGNLKRAMKFRQFLLRGHQKVKAEWLLACTAWNIRHLHALKTP